MSDVLIMGGGIIGAVVTPELKRRHPNTAVRLIEKESAIATHQTGHNSGVLHAGMYYEPVCLKARFFREGADATIGFCEADSIPYEQYGKLIVATDEHEQERLLALYERAHTSRHLPSPAPREFLYWAPMNLATIAASPNWQIVVHD